jgi:hypothetical protein
VSQCGESGVSVGCFIALYRSDRGGMSDPGAWRPNLQGPHGMRRASGSTRFGPGKLRNQEVLARRLENLGPKVRSTKPCRRDL